MPGRFACYHPPPSRHRIPIATSGSPCRTPRWDTARHDQRFDSLVCPAEHLSRHSPRSVGPVEHALLLVDLHGILVGDVSVGGEFRSGGGRLWSRADVLVRFRNLYRFLPLDLDTGLHLALLAPALCFLAAVFSWLRGPALQHPTTSLRDEVAQGYSSGGNVAMVEAGAGAEGEFVEGAPAPEARPGRRRHAAGGCRSSLRCGSRPTGIRSN